MTDGTTPPPLQGETCSTREAATMLGVSLRTVQLWVDGGMLDAWKTVGGHRRVSLASIRRLAAKFAQDKPAARGQPGRGSRPAATVLVVEDDADLLRLYQAEIESWQLPLTLLTAANGFEGLIRIGEQAPDLLIADLDMPGMDGFQMLRALRASRGYAHMQVVVVTGLDREDVESRGGIPAGVELYGKPVPFERLRATLERLLAKPRRARLRTG